MDTASVWREAWISKPLSLSYSAARRAFAADLAARCTSLTSIVVSIGAFGIVGAGLPVAVGAGLSAQLAGRRQVSACFFGDGAVNIGAFHEAMNMAQVWKLPVIFVCENNLYGEFSHILHTTPYEDLVIRAAGYSMQTEKVDGNDVLAVYDAAAAAVVRARDGDGPDLHRVQDLSPSRPFAHRSGQVSRSSGGRGLDRSEIRSRSTALSSAPRTS